jgi:uncharacterized protein (TIGR02147 family)
MLNKLSPIGYSDYKEYLKAMIAQNKAERAFQSKLAEAAQCQKSFLSQVLNTHVHLTVDHAASMSLALALSELEASYFVDLVLLARTSASALKKMIRARLKAAVDAQSLPSERFKWPSLSEKNREIYYSSWHWATIHIMTAVPHLQTAEAIANHLKLPHSVVEETLKGLEKMNLIRAHESGWAPTDHLTYLPKSSPMTQANHLHWRQRALNDIQTMKTDSLHYSAVFAISVDDFEKVKEMIVNSIERINQKISLSPSEEVAAFTCDIFKVT